MDGNYEVRFRQESAAVWKNISGYAVSDTSSPYIIIILLLFKLVYTL